jgi:hypothetical protein
MSNFVRDITRALGQGAALGFADEAEAKAFGRESETYEDALARIREQNAAFYDRRPKTALAAELVGGLAPTIAAYFAPPLAPVAGAKNLGTLNRLKSLLSPSTQEIAQRTLPQNITRGATSAVLPSAIAGAGASEDQGLGRLDDALVGGGFGLVTGAAMPIVPYAAGAIGRRFAPNKAGIQYAASQNIFNEMGKQLPTIKAIQDAFDLDATYGIPDSVLYNMSPRLSRQAEMLTTRGGDATEILGETAESQIANAREGVRRTIIGETDPQTGARVSGLGRPDYYNELDRLTTDLYANARPLYNAAYNYGEVLDPDVLKYLELPQFKQAMGAANELAEAKGTTIDFTVPTVQNLDQVKRGLDVLIEKQTDPVTGKVSTLGQIYRDTKNEFLTALDDAVPEYRVARQQYAGDAEVRDALNNGYKNFMEYDSEQIARMAGRMSVAEKEAFKDGVVSNLFRSINDTSMEKNFAKLYANNPEMMKKLKPLFESEAQFDLFDAALRRQSQMFRQSTSIVRGSQTAGRTAAIERFEGNPFANALMDVGSAASLGKMVLMAQRHGVSDRVAQRMAEMLNAGPNEIAAVVAALEEYAKRSESLGRQAFLGTRGAATSGRNLLIENYDTDQYEGPAQDDPRVMRASELLGQGTDAPQESVRDRARRMGIE